MSISANLPLSVFKGVRGSCCNTRRCPDPSHCRLVARRLPSMDVFAWPSSFCTSSHVVCRQWTSSLGRVRSARRRTSSAVNGRLRLAEFALHVVARRLPSMDVFAWPSSLCTSSHVVSRQWTSSLGRVRSARRRTSPAVNGRLRSAEFALHVVARRLPSMDVFARPSRQWTTRSGCGDPAGRVQTRPQNNSARQHSRTCHSTT